MLANIMTSDLKKKVAGHTFVQKNCFLHRSENKLNKSVIGSFHNGAAGRGAAPAPPTALFT